MHKLSRFNRARQAGQTLAATLIVVAIILVLVVVMFKGSTVFGDKSGMKARPDGKGTTILGQARFAAKDDVCRSNLQQVRESITVFESSSDDHPPDTIQDTKLGSDFYKCPVGGEPYAYDPSTGQVHCVHPGHENY